MYKNIDWAGKLSSRKFWALIAALLTAVLVLFRVSDEVITQVVAVVGAFASIAVYIFAEASIDAARAGKPETIVEFVDEFEDEEE